MAEEIKPVKGIKTKDGVVHPIWHPDQTTSIVKPKKNVGGITTNDDLTGMTVQEILEKMLAPYIAPTIGSLTITAGAISTLEEGSTRTLSKFKCSYTANDGNIVKAELYDGSTLLASSTGESYSSNKEITLDEAKTYSTAKTFTCKLTTEKGTVLSTTASYGYTTYAYTKCDPTTETPTTSLVKQDVISTFKSKGKEITYKLNDYIYFYITESSKKVQTNVMGQWVDVDYTEIGETNITMSNGCTKKYIAYKIGPMIASGTAVYRVGD